MRDCIFVDTAGWASLFIKTELFHLDAKKYFNQYRKDNIRFITTNYILVELVALLNSPIRTPRSMLFKVINAIREAPYVNLIHITDAIDLKAWELIQKRKDKLWSLVDVSSFIVMEQFNIQNAFTTDHHFEQAGFIRLLK